MIRKQISALFQELIDKDRVTHMDTGQLMMIGMVLQQIDGALAMKFVLLAGTRMLEEHRR